MRKETILGFLMLFSVIGGALYTENHFKDYIYSNAPMFLFFVASCVTLTLISILIIIGGRIGDDDVE